MRRRRQPEREGYREPAKPNRVPFTVVTVRPGEFAQPEWLQRLLERLGRLRARWVPRAWKARHDRGRTNTPEP